MISAQAALQRLREGNRRFVSDFLKQSSLASQTLRSKLVAGQEPFATILGCSDSRVPVEMIFDQGPGDLFVIRVAGNIVTPTQLGSIEFAAEWFGTPLVVVLGHTGCGAVRATLEEIVRSPESQPSANLSPNLLSIVDCIRPTVKALLAEDPSQNPDALWQQAVRANVRNSVNHLRQGSQILNQRILSDELLVVGAEYSLETGIVDFFDGEV